MLVLTDGLSNAGKLSAQDALAALQRTGAVCDALIVGSAPRCSLPVLHRLVAVEGREARPVAVNQRDVAELPELMLLGVGQLDLEGAT